MNPASRSKHQAILSAARRIFLAHGYSGASMEAIAEAAPVSKPTLYSHFHGKSELFAAVIAAQCEILIQALDQAHVAMPDPVAGLKAIATSFVDLVYSPEGLGLLRLLIAERQQFPELGRLAYQSSAMPVLERLSSYLSELQQQGQLASHDVDSSSRMLLGLLKGEPHLRCLLGLQDGLDETEKRQIIDDAIGLFLRGHGHAS